MTDIILDEETHTYTCKGVRYKSVTQIISENGLNGFDKYLQLQLAQLNSLKTAELRSKVVELPGTNPQLKSVYYAGLFGNAVHKTIELYVNGTLELNSVDDEIMSYLDAYEYFRTLYSFCPISTEKIVGDHRLKIAGKYDMVGMIDDKLSLVDIKTSAQLPIFTGLQTAAYMEMYNQDKEGGGKIKNRYGLLLKNDGRFELKKYDNKMDWKYFLSAVSVSNWIEIYLKK